MIKGKKGEELTSFYEIFIYLAICVVIIGGTTMFYLKDIDVRKIESEIFYAQLVECFSDNGFLNEQVLEENFDVFEFCKINKKIFDEKLFYMNVQFISGDEELRKPIIFGNYDFREACLYKEGGGVAKKWAECSQGEERIFYYSEGESKIGLIKIMVASNQKGERKR